MCIYFIDNFEAINDIIREYNQLKTTKIKLVILRDTDLEDLKFLKTLLDPIIEAILYFERHDS